MNLKSIISVVSVLGIFDKLRFNKNRKQKNIKEKSIEQKNTILKKDNTNSPSYTNINYEYKPSTRKTPRRTRTQQPKNFSLESTMEWKHCPYCDKRINKKAKKCPYCNYDFERGTLGAEIVCNSITTKTVNKNGLSFECPDYYDIGIYKSEDEIYKSIVALSKNDRECEIYVMEYRPTTFHWKLRKKPNLLKKNLNCKDMIMLHIIKILNIVLMQ